MRDLNPHKSISARIVVAILAGLLLFLPAQRVEAGTWEDPFSIRTLPPSIWFGHPNWQMGIGPQRAGEGIRLYRMTPNQVEVMAPILPVPATGEAFETIAIHEVPMDYPVALASDAVDDTVMTVIAEDIDGDGILDLLVPGPKNRIPIVYLKGLPEGGFKDVTIARVASVPRRNYHGIALWDANADGHPDVVAMGLGDLESGISFGTVTPPQTYVLFINDGHGFFRDFVTLPTVSNYPNAIVFFDMDGDNLAEAWSSNDLGFGDQRDNNLKTIDRNPGGLPIIEDIYPGMMNSDLGRMGMGFDIAHLYPGAPLFVHHTSIGSGVAHERDPETGKFNIVSGGYGSQSTFDKNAYRTKWGPVFVDLDLDGRTDLLEAGRGVGAAVIGLPDALTEGLLMFRFEEDGKFRAGEDTHGYLKTKRIRAVEPLDMDNDGRMDVIGWTVAGDPLLMMNTLPPLGHGISITLDSTVSAPRATGGTVHVTCGNELVPGGENAQDSTWTRYIKDCVMSQGCFRGMVHVGVGDCEGPLTTVVEWPSGYIQTVYQLPVDQGVTITEPDWFKVVSEPHSTEDLTIHIAPIQQNDDEPGCSEEPVNLHVITATETTVLPAPCDTELDIHIGSVPWPDIEPGSYFGIAAEVGGVVFSHRIRLQVPLEAPRANIQVAPSGLPAETPGYVWLKMDNDIEGDPPEITVMGAVATGDLQELEPNVYMLPVDLPAIDTPVHVRVHRGDVDYFDSVVGNTVTPCEIVKTRIQSVQDPEGDPAADNVEEQLIFQFIMEGPRCPTNDFELGATGSYTDGSGADTPEIRLRDSYIKVLVESLKEQELHLDMTTGGLGVLTFDQHLLPFPETPEQLLEELNPEGGWLYPMAFIQADGRDIAPVGFVVRTMDDKLITQVENYNITVECEGGVEQVYPYSYHLPALTMARLFVRAGTEPGDHLCEIMIAGQPTGITGYIQVDAALESPTVDADNTLLLVSPSGGGAMSVIVFPRDSAGNLIGSSTDISIFAVTGEVTTPLTYAGRGLFVGLYTPPEGFGQAQIQIHANGVDTGVGTDFLTYPAGGFRYWPVEKPEYEVPDIFFPEGKALNPIGISYPPIPPEAEEEEEPHQGSSAIKLAPMPEQASGCTTGPSPTGTIFFILLFWCGVTRLRPTLKRVS